MILASILLSAAATLPMTVVGLPHSSGSVISALSGNVKNAVGNVRDDSIFQNSYDTLNAIALKYQV